MKPLILLLAFLSFALAPSAPMADPAFFPIGMDEAPSCAGGLCSDTSAARTTLDRIRGNPSSGYVSGFNIVHSYWHQGDVTHIRAAGVRDYLDEAHAYGFKVLVNIAGYADADNNWTLSIPSECPHFFQWAPPFCDSAVVLIDSIKAHPAIYGYLLADEPNDIYSTDGYFRKAISAQQLAAAYSTLRDEADATHPYVVTMADYDEERDIWGDTDSTRADWRWNNHGSITWTDTLRYQPVDTTYPPVDTTVTFSTSLDYTSAADIITNDTYVLNDDAQWTAGLRQFDDLVASKPGHVHAELGCWRSSGGGPRNTLAQQRYQAYTAIIHGAVGVWFYGYGAADDNTYDPGVLPSQPPAYFLDVLVPLSQELAGIQGLLAGHTLGDVLWGGRRGLTASVSDTDIHYVIKSATGEVLLIAANTSARPLTARVFLRTLPVSDSTALLRNAVSVEVVSENRAVDVAHGILTDDFAPYDVHVYRFTQAFSPPRPPAELLACKTRLNTPGHTRYGLVGLPSSPDTLLHYGGTALPYHELKGVWTDPAYFQCTAMTHGDYDGDGYDEVVVAASTPDHWHTSVSMYVYQPSYREVLLYDKTNNSGNDSAYVSALSSGDIDGNGTDELLIATQKSGVPGHTRYRVSGIPTRDTILHYRGGSLPYYELDSAWPEAYFQCTAMTHGDYNGDGYDELVIAGSTPEHWHTSMTMYTYHPDTTIIVYDKTNAQGNDSLLVSALASGDCDGNGRSELYVVMQRSGVTGHTRYRVSGVPTSPAPLLHCPDDPLPYYELDGRWTDAAYFQSPALACGDYNGDGYDELVVSGSTPEHWHSSVSMYSYSPSYQQILLYDRTNDSGNGGYYFNALSSGRANGDWIPPQGVADLSLRTGRTSAVVTWTAPGDDGVSGAASEYELRYSTSAITAENFSGATRLSTPSPGEAGSTECVEFFGLAGCTKYYFGLRTRDEASNWSPLSNLPTGTTKCSGYELAVCEGGLESEPSREKLAVPDAMALGTPQPNPGTDFVSVCYSVPDDSSGTDLDLAVFDVLGRRVQTLVQGASRPGYFTATWTLRDRRGAEAPRGVYFVRYRLGSQEQVRRVCVLR